MAFYVNRLTIIGRLGSDAEMKSFQNGGAVVNFRVATTETWKGSNGDKQERTEWHSIAVFAKWLIDDAQKLRKGDMVAIEGKQQTRKWQDSSGQDRYSTECVLQGFEHSLFKIERRERGEGGGGQRSGGNDWGGGGSGAGSSTNQRYGGGHTSDNGGSGGGWGGAGGGSPKGGFADDLDDDIPFATNDPAYEGRVS